MGYKEASVELEIAREKFGRLCDQAREADGGWTVSPEMRWEIEVWEDRIEWLKGEKEFFRLKELQEEDDAIASVST